MLYYIFMMPARAWNKYLAQITLNYQNTVYGTINKTLNSWVGTLEGIFSQDQFL